RSVRWSSLASARPRFPLMPVMRTASRISETPYAISVPTAASGRATCPARRSALAHALATSIEGVARTARSNPVDPKFHREDAKKRRFHGSVPERRLVLRAAKVHQIHKGFSSLLRVFAVEVK